MRPRSGAPPSPRTAARARGGGDCTRIGDVFRQTAFNPKSANAASAIVVSQVRALTRYGVEHPEVRLQLRAAMRDAVVELEQSRLVAAETFLASRRGGA
jgi:hypothetical protein